MYDVLFVHVVESQQDLFHYSCGACFVKFLAPHNLLEKLTAIYDLSYDVEISLVFNEIVNSYDVWVVNSCQYFEFLLH